MIFVGLPLLAGWQGQLLRRWVIPQMLLLAGIFLALVWRDASFDRRQIRAVPQDWPRGLLRIVVFFVAGGAAVLYLAWRSGVDLFFFPRERPFLWLLVLLLYPLVSALAQEVIFRVFLFHRYRSLFPDPRLMMLVSASAFALAHLELGNCRRRRFLSSVACCSPTPSPPHARCRWQPWNTDSGATGSSRWGWECISMAGTFSREQGQFRRAIRSSERPIRLR